MGPWGGAQSKLALEWREWMTARLTEQYFEDRTFYQVTWPRRLPCRHAALCAQRIVSELRRWRAQVQAAGLLDNPDQRISSDIRRAAEGEVFFERDAWELRLLCDRLGNAIAYCAQAFSLKLLSMKSFTTDRWLSQDLHRHGAGPEHDAAERRD